MSRPPFGSPVARYVAIAATGEERSALHSYAREHYLAVIVVDDAATAEWVIANGDATSLLDVEAQR